MNLKSSVAIAGCVALLTLGGAASASTVALTESTTAAGSVSSGVTTGLAVPGSYTYANSFSAGAGGTPILGSSSGFFDDYVFSIAGGSFDTIASTINLTNLLQIQGLQVALFSYSSGQTLPVYGTTPPSGGTMIDGWSTPISGGGVTGTVSVIAPTTLGQGSYVLEVRGLVTGTAGGSYSGVLNVAPVPLPPALPFLLSGLAGLGVWGRRRIALA